MNCKINIVHFVILKSQAALSKLGSIQMLLFTMTGITYGAFQQAPNIIQALHCGYEKHVFMVLIEFSHARKVLRYESLDCDNIGNPGIMSSTA